MAVKICSRCNEEFSEETIVCKYCGLLTKSAEGSPPGDIRKSGKMTLAWTLAVIVLVLIILFALFKF